MTFDNSEEVQSEVLVIGEGASPDTPFEDGIYCFNVTLEGDDLKESREAFDLSLQSDDDCAWLGRDIVTLLALPNGVVNVSIEGSMYVLESERFVEVCVVADHDSEASYEVVVRTRDDSATSGMDYLAVNKSLVFAFGLGTRQCVNIPILGDECLEETEDFYVSLSSSQNCVVYGVEEIQISIREDDVTKVGFENPEYTVTEEGSDTTLCLTFDRKLEKSITINFTLEALMTFNNNETILSDVLVIGENADSGDPFVDRRYCFNISLKEDNLKESIEAFALRLQSDDECVCLGRDRAILLVQANGVVNVSIEGDAHVRVNESGGYVEVCVMADHDSQATYEVTISTMSGSATAGEDYISVSKRLVFAFGFETRQCVDIPILGDECLEETESFTVSLSSDQDCVEFGVDEIEVYIVEDDSTKVGFELAEYEVSGEGIPTLVCLTYDRKLERSINVRYTLEALMTFDNNERVQSEALVLGENASPDDRRYCFNISLEEDAYKESREAFVLRLESDDGFVCLGRDRALVLAESNGVVTVSIEGSAHVSVNESGGFVEVCVMADHDSEASYEVILSTRDGSATYDMDYVAVRKSLVFTFGFGTRQCVNIPILSDECLEETESFYVSLSSNQSCVEFGLDEIQVYIEEDDVTKVGFQEPEYTMVEGVPTTLCLFLDKKLEKSLSVSYTLSHLLPLANNEAVKNDVLVIGEGASRESPFVDREYCFDITMEEDDFKEDVEFFSLSLQTEDSCVWLSQSLTLLRVLPNGAVIVSLEASVFYIDESEGFVKVCAVADHQFETSFEVIIRTADSEALAGEDYVAVNKYILFSPERSLTECVHIPVLNDKCLEDMESFYVSMSSNETCVQIGENDTAQVTIFDNDRVLVGFTQEVVRADEGVGLVRACVEVCEGILKRSVTIFVDYQNGSALFPQDYEDNERRVFALSPDNYRYCFNVSFIDDPFVEYLEYFNLVLSSEDTSVAFKVDTMRVEIVDDDCAILDFAETVYRVSEEDGYFEICVDLTGELDRGIRASIDFVLTTAEGSDLDDMSQSLYFVEAGRQCINVTISSDMLVESLEQVVAVLRSEDSAVKLGQSSALIAIMDSDTVTVGFEQMSYTAMEEDESGNGFSLEVCLTFEGMLDRSVTVAISTSDGSAVGGLDYDEVIGAPTTYDVTFEPVRKRRSPMSPCTTITILADDLVEYKEYFNAVLSTTDESVVLLPQSTTIYIENNDVATISLECSSAEVSESIGEVDVCAILVEGELAINVSANASTVCTDTCGDFQALVSESLAFLSGASIGTRSCTSVIIEGDDITENDEMFQVVLTSTLSQVQISPNATKDILILNDDVVTVGFESDSYTSEEGDGLNICAELQSGSLERDVIFLMDFDDGTATLDVDFSVPQNPATLTFDSGSQLGSTSCVTVVIIDDTLFEPIENFNVVLRPWTDQPVIISSPSSVIAQIEQDPEDVVMIGFSTNEQRVLEGEQANVCVQLIEVEGVLFRAVEFRLQTSDSSTTAGEDYESVDLTLSISGEETCINITTLCDGVFEIPDQSFFVSITSDDPAVTFNNLDQVEIVIEDKDEVSLTPRPSEVCENAMEVEICVDNSLDIPIEGQLTVTVETVEGTASDTEDFIGKTAVLTFEGNAPFRCMNVAIVDDSEAEEPESFRLDFNTNFARVSIVDTMVTVVIYDDDDVSINFIENTPTATEPGGASSSIALMYSRGGSDLDVQCILPPQGMVVDCSPNDGPVFRDTIDPLSRRRTGFANMTVQVNSHSVCGGGTLGVISQTLTRVRQNQCSVQLINDGFTVADGVVSAEFVGVGDTTDFQFRCTTCSDDGDDSAIPCSAGSVTFAVSDIICSSGATRRLRIAVVQSDDCPRIIRLDKNF